jgi:hypothetical protein
MLHLNQSFPRKPSVTFPASTRAQQSYTRKLRFVGCILHFSAVTQCAHSCQQNILREFEQHPPHPNHGHHDQDLEPHHSAPRSRSNSPPPLPRKPPSPKVTFNTEMQPESKVTLTRKESTRHGVELKDEVRPPPVDLARQDSAKPSSSSKNRDPKEEDITRSTSHVSNF